MSDSAQVKISAKTKDILQHLCIDDWQSELHHQHQNPFKRKCQDIKRISNRLMDCTDSPPSAWLLALKCAACVLDHAPCSSLDGEVPLQVLISVTQDISAFLHFQRMSGCIAMKMRHPLPNHRRLWSICWLLQ